MTPDVSVIIPHYNDIDRLRLCLAGLARQTLPPARFEIIVADNGTPGGLGTLPVEFPRVRFLHVNERGAACARNAGMEAAVAGVFAFIDADCLADVTWIEHGLSGLCSADLVGGEVEVSLAPLPRPTAVECFEQVFAFRQRAYIEKKRFSVTANLFAKASAARAIGPFINGVAEDLNWCRRAGALGFHLVFNPKAKVSHPARRTWSDLVLKWERLIKERRNGFNGGSPERRLLWAALALATLLSAVPHVFSVLQSGRLTTFRQKAGAAMVLGRIRVWRARRMLSLLRPE